MIEQSDIRIIEDSLFCGEREGQTRTIVHFKDGSRACSCGRFIDHNNKRLIFNLK